VVTLSIYDLRESEHSVEFSFFDFRPFKTELKKKRCGIRDVTFPAAREGAPEMRPSFLMEIEHKQIYWRLA